MRGIWPRMCIGSYNTELICPFVGSDLTIVLVPESGIMKNEIYDNIHAQRLAGNIAEAGPLAGS